MVGKKIIAVVVIALLAAAAYFALFQKTEQIKFSDGFAELKGIWMKAGIDISDLPGETEKFENLGATQLSTAKSNLLAFKSGLGKYSESSDKKTLAELADIYANLAELKKRQIEIEGIETQLASVGIDESCGYIGKYGERNAKRKAIADLLKSLSAQVDGFIARHATENAVAGFHALSYDFDEIKNDIDAKDQALVLLESACSEGG